MSREARGRMVCAVSGKGGVGKTNLIANVAVAAAGLGAKVLLIDGDLGLANVDVLLGLTPPLTVADVLEHRCSFEEALLEGPRGVHILPASSGRADLPALRPTELAALLLPLFESASRYDLVLVDAGAGLSAAMIGLAAACQQAILLTTGEPTSLADAYATLKVLSREAPDLHIGVFVNWARDEIQARDTHSRLERIASRFLGRSPAFLGYLTADRRLADSVRRQCAVVEAYPTASSSQTFIELAGTLLRGPAGSRATASEPTTRNQA